MAEGRRRLWLLAMVVCAALAIVLSLRGTPDLNDDQDQEFDIMKVVPRQVGGWDRKAPTRYTPDNLYEYINGGAELYISYGFKEASSFVFEKDGEPEIVLDIFDMGSPENASGVFTHSAGNPGDDYGQGSEVSAAVIVFWQGRRYVSILAWPQTEESLADFSPSVSP